MKKIVILGCENSHAKQFLGFIRNNEKYADVYVAGVYSDDKVAAEKFSADFGVEVLPAPDAAAGQADGVIVTARHGAKHYEFAKPYMKSGVPMFIDKPVTVSPSDALSLVRDAKKNGVRLTGGSCLIHEDYVNSLKAKVESNSDGKVYGGFVRAPISFKNNYGDFFFYAQHLVETVMHVFGRYPEAVKAYKNGSDVATVVFRYNSYDVIGEFIEENYVYYASVSTEKGVYGNAFEVGESCFAAEFDAFYSLLCGEKQKTTYDDFIAPVFVLDAINESLQSGREVPIKFEKA